MVSVVITCWNGRSLLEKNLPFLLKAAENKNNQIKEIIIVDDKSADDSVAFVKEYFPSVKITSHSQNMGYAAACNTGVGLATNALVAILNLDVVPSENFLEHALPLFSRKDVFAVSFNEGKFGPGKIVWEKGFLEIKPTEVKNTTEKTDWANGGSSIFKKEIWEKLGGMDQLFLPFYFEDIDLSLRAKKNGFVCLWEPKAKVKHEHEATINQDNFKKSYLDSIKQRNQLLLTWRSIDSFTKLTEHFLFLGKRCLLHPGYFKILLLALIRKLTWSFKRV